MLYKLIELEKVIFFDIETIPKFKNLQDLLENGKSGEIDKVQNMAEKQGVELNDDNSEFLATTALIPELNQVICVAFGSVVFDKDENGNIISKDNYKMNIKSYASLEDEKSILDNCYKAFNNKSPFILGGFNIINFDICVLQKHYLKYGMLPNLLNTFGKKPWDIKVLDLCLDWKGSGNYLSPLSLVSDFLGVENPKDSEVTGKNMFHKLNSGETNIDSVSVYCKKDVESLIKCCLKLSN